MKRVVVSATLAIPLSQLGHALAYTLHYGSAAVPRQSGGLHAYFPALLGTAAVSLAASLLIALLLVGLARRLTSLRGGPRLSTAWPVLPVLAVLCLVQITIFSGQELAEGVPLTPIVLVYGLLGQVPVAAAAALALAWISIRVVRALRLLRRPRLVLNSFPAAPRSVLAPSPPVVTGVALLPGGNRRRGPPSPSTIRD